jgi:benzoyl-CoA reductase/2-hydroxyglutaryl-CoA dehydratase subunit BcrC/BadD/HgdB
MAELIDRFREALDRPDNEFVCAHKDRGGSVCGYWCSYIPEELIIASGMLPVRVRGVGSEDCSTGDAWLSTRLCTFSRWALSAAMDGHYDFLDGMIGLNCCDQVRRASQVWMDRVEIPFSHFLALPRVLREINFQAYLREVGRLKSRLEEFTGEKVSDDALAEAVSATNEKRELLTSIASLRKPGSAGHVAGSEMLAVSVASTQMPNKEFLDMGKGFLSGREEQAPPKESARARLIVCGGELDDPAYLEVLEGQGAQIVGEFICFGARSYMEQVELKGDPLEDIARRQFYHVPCCCMGEGFTDRFNALKNMMKEYEADGLVFQRMKFCQLWGADNHNMIEFCRREGIPMLTLEREHGVISTGQIKTRIQAFLESIEAKRTRP